MYRIVPTTSAQGNNIVILQLCTLEFHCRIISTESVSRPPLSSPSSRLWYRYGPVRYGHRAGTRFIAYSTNTSIYYCSHHTVVKLIYRLFTDTKQLSTKNVVKLPGQFGCRIFFRMHDNCTYRNIIINVEHDLVWVIPLFLNLWVFWELPSDHPWCVYNEECCFKYIHLNHVVGVLSVHVF